MPSRAAVRPSPVPKSRSYGLDELVCSRALRFQQCPATREPFLHQPPEPAIITLSSSLVHSSELKLVPRHSGFDWLGVTENGQVLGGAEHLDAARDAWLAADMAEALQREDHLVHGRRGELEMALHVGLGRGTAVDAGIGVDEGQVLPPASR